MADPARFVIYLDNAREYRWRLRAPNGKIIADSAEGYVTNQGCRDGTALVRAYAPTALLVDTTR